MYKIIGNRKKCKKSVFRIFNDFWGSLSILMGYNSRKNNNSVSGILSWFMNLTFSGRFHRCPFARCLRLGFLAAESDLSCVMLSTFWAFQRIFERPISPKNDQGTTVFWSVLCECPGYRPKLVSYRFYMITSAPSSEAA